MIRRFVVYINSSGLQYPTMYFVESMDDKGYAVMAHLYALAAMYERLGFTITQTITENMQLTVVQGSNYITYNAEIVPVEDPKA